jgi:hypothetical protein
MELVAAVEQEQRADDADDALGAEEVAEVQQRRVAQAEGDQPAVALEYGKSFRKLYKP